MKTCSLCGQTKPIGEFYKDSRSKDGKGNRCKACCHESYKKHEEKRKLEMLVESLSEENSTLIGENQCLKDTFELTEEKLSQELESSLDGDVNCG